MLDGIAALYFAQAPAIHYNQHRFLCHAAKVIAWVLRKNYLPGIINFLYLDLF